MSEQKNRIQELIQAYHDVAEGYSARAWGYWSDATFSDMHPIPGLPFSEGFQKEIERLSKHDKGWYDEKEKKFNKKAEKIEEEIRKLQSAHGPCAEADHSWECTDEIPFRPVQPALSSYKEQTVRQYFKCIYCGNSMTTDRTRHLSSKMIC